MNHLMDSTVVDFEELGYTRVGILRPKTLIADVQKNLAQIKLLLEKTRKEMADFLLFPEMCLTGYTLGDLVNSNLIHASVEEALADLKVFSSDFPSMFVVGAPLFYNGQLFNCAIMIGGGRLIGAIPKTYLPSSNEFYEARWFCSGKGLQDHSIRLAEQEVPFGPDILFHPIGNSNLKIGIEVCEDLWAVKPPSSDLSLAGANLILNLSASNAVIGKHSYRKSLILQQSARTLSNYVYVSAGPSESSTDTVYSGYGLVAECGEQVCEMSDLSLDAGYHICDVDFQKTIFDRSKNASFKSTQPEITFRHVEFSWPKNHKSLKSELRRIINRLPFVPKVKKDRDDICEEVLAIQSVGLASRIKHIGCKRAVVGLSGGLDSTLAVIVISEAFKMLGKDNYEILAVTMPGFGTSARTLNNAVKLAEELGANLLTVDISNAVSKHLVDIGADVNTPNITFENSQARERTQTLFDYANEQDAILVGTGDLSESALGWCTFAGDHISSYHVNCGVPKTLLKHVIEWYSVHRSNRNLHDILNDILNTPVSPELLPLEKSEESSQKTEDILGAYEVHDFFLYYFVRYGFKPTKIFFLANQAFGSAYSCEYILEKLEIFFERFFTNQFKRSCAPDGPKIGSIALSPRADWRMPSDASSNLWLNDLKKCKQIK